MYKLIYQNSGVISSGVTGSVEPVSIQRVVLKYINFKTFEMKVANNANQKVKSIFNAIIDNRGPKNVKLDKNKSYCPSEHPMS